MLTWKINRWLGLSFLVYLLALLAYGIFSYSLTAPNLVLSQNQTFWQFQSFMWQTFFNHRELLTKVYASLMVIIFATYFWFSSQLLKQKKLTLKLVLGLLVGLSLPLLLANNALSYDVFNYIFNAKMVAVYGADPHVQVALDFPDDPWLKFMHNIHTTAPYGRGWTYLSLLPLTLGLGKFLLTWWSFKIFSWLPLILLTVIYWCYARPKNLTWLVLLVFNPLVLIEVAANAHNDLWMMLPGIASLLLLSQARLERGFWLKAALSFLILFGSMWIKLATVLLIPVWLLIIAKPLVKNIPRFESVLSNWPLLASLAMFVPLLTARSQQFHPWYLLWPLVFVPLIRPNRWIRIWGQALFVLTISSMFRYLPFLWNNNYEGQVLLWQKIITFAPFLLALVVFGKQAILPTVKSPASKTKK